MAYMSSTYLISVLLPCHSLKFLEKCIESISNQSIKGEFFEVVIIADRVNPIEILSILKKYQLNFRVVESKVPGIVAALNLGIQEISSKYVVRMDEDDLMEPTRIERQFKFMEKFPNTLALGGQLQLIDEVGADLGVAHYRKNFGRSDFNILRNSPIAHPASIFRLDAVKSIGGYRDFLSEDWDLWVRLYEVGTIGNLKDVVLKYRIHPSQLSREKMYSQNMSQRFVAASFYARASALEDHPKPGEDSIEWLERIEFELKENSPRFNSFVKQIDRESKIAEALQLTSKSDKTRRILHLACYQPISIFSYLSRILRTKLRGILHTHL